MIDASENYDPSGLLVAHDQNPVARFRRAPCDGNLNVASLSDGNARQRRRVATNPMAHSPLDRSPIAAAFKVAEEMIAAIAEWKSCAEEAAPGPVTLHKDNFLIGVAAEEVGGVTKGMPQLPKSLDVGCSEAIDALDVQIAYEQRRMGYHLAATANPQ